MAAQWRAVAHSRDGAVQEVEPSTIDELLLDHRSLLWVDIQDPGPEDINILREEFAFHELALEDALRGHQRPKVEEYSDYYFLVVYAAAFESTGEIVTREIRCLWGKNYMVTLHEGVVAEVEAALQRWTTSHEHRQQGVAYQMYALLDAVMDGYFPLVDAMSERIEEIEDRLFQSDASVVREVFSLRRQLLEARRVLAPSRDVLNELIRRDIPVFPPSLVPYLADVYDHAIRAIDTLDLHRDLLATAIESHLSVTSNRLNQSMRTLTAITIALMGPTLIAGIYGMNFRHMPELEWMFGYPWALALMAAAGGLAILLARRFGWL